MKMKKPIFDRNLAFNNIVSTGVGESKAKPEKQSEAKPEKPNAPTLSISWPQETTAPDKKIIEKEHKNNAYALIPTTVYLTRQQRKALKLRLALSDGFIDKDQSAIVRAALDSYLSDILKQFEA
ncbi:MAG: hypothetical protein LBI74_07930 [Synergistaceae bacterium]|jgi:hypothetical protein|nr:hypothetical protein [Synergistaceae bacterium]